jgi:chemotaxis protein methyltransferase CheR
VFDALGADVLPALAARAAARGARTLECWSAGCASGEEPYSLRLVWDFAAKPRSPDVDLSVLATDADEVMLERAARACYPAGALKDLPPGWRERAFEPADGQFRLREAFRTGVTFSKADIRQAWPDGPFDLILCRNLAFTYFEPALQAEVLGAIARRLGPGGVLVLGAHERPPEGGADFVPLIGKLPLYGPTDGPDRTKERPRRA